MKLIMAKSLAGHDKGRMYVCLGEDENDVILVDGRVRTMDRPKRKRRHHVQLVIHFPDEVSRMAALIEKWDDVSVRKVIRTYTRLLNGPK